MTHAVKNGYYIPLFLAFWNIYSMAALYRRLYVYDILLHKTPVKKNCRILDIYPFHCFNENLYGGVFIDRMLTRVRLLYLLYIF